ncbi:MULTISPECIES: sodium:proton antiporter [unclassified Leifsonia]|uniref:cation:proton antiporter n=1 Tax=unclassified Leifsonia TaxID=2663824 RepID=UPI0009261364|nr:cation:proton antiporter [Leifsonia sp. 71-9]OJX78939.1 MAG: cation:proton antiporter [Leifsonia sp. 71-9]
MEIGLVVGVLAVLAIAAATTIGPKFGVASPLILVIAGILVSLLPFVPAVDIEPQWILAGILPPLLYSASVSMPSMNFRREFTAIGGLSVLLVVLSSVILGFFFSWAIPGLDLAWGIALGAIVSPTDAVATSIVKKSGVSPRVVAILEGESLLNDATALVLLRAAIAAAAASFAIGTVIWTFTYSVVIAVVFGWVVGRVNLIVRARVTDATVNTVISFTVPFIASLPAEALGASGLVAAVVAGLVTGSRAPRVLSPQHRLSDAQNWRTVELVLEGMVFLTMGLQLFGIVQKVEKVHEGVLPAALVAAGALLLTILVRAAYVAPLLRSLGSRARRSEKLRPRIETMQQRIADADNDPKALVRTGGPGSGRVPSEKDVGRFTTRLRRTLADIDYFAGAPLGWREGTIVVWAGMRGAVTVAAAQTLPVEGTPSRPVLILIAFLVAAGSLLIQGGTIGWLLKLVKPAQVDRAAQNEERQRVMSMLHDAAKHIPLPESRERTPENMEVMKKFALDRLHAQRTALLDARDDGTFDADVLASALTNLDADEISISLKGSPPED